MTDLDFSFIRLRDSIADAQNLKESPTVTQTYGGQIQLLPQAADNIFQASNSPVTLPFDTYQIFVVRACDNEDLEDVSANFFLGNFTDVNGLEQLVFEISNLPTDHHGTLVYFRFELTFAAVTTSYYTNTFLITRDFEDKTTRFDYRNDTFYEGTDYDAFIWYQSIRLNMYFKEYVSQDELTPYYQISRRQNINQRVNNADINRYIFPFLNAWTAKRVKRMLYGDRVYITRFNDSIGIRNYMVEAFDMPPRLENSNVGQGEYLVDPDDSDTREAVDQITDQNMIFSDGNNTVFSDGNNVIV